MTKASTLLAKFVSSFIEENASEELLEMWGDKKKEFLKLADKLINKDKVVKEKKSADAPKGARTSYILFCMEERPKIVKEFPEMKNQDIVKLMAERWGIAKDDDEILNEFKIKADEDKERAAKDKENYVPSTGDKPKKKVVRTKTGYLLFCDDERANVKEDGFTGVDIMKELGKRWKELPEEDEDRYTEFMEKAANLKKEKMEESDVEEEEPKKKVVKKTKKVVKKTKKVVKKTKKSKSESVSESESESENESD